MVKLFFPDTNCTWLLSEIDPDDHDIAFGLCDLGMGFPELGNVLLPEILATRSRLGFAIERDRYFNGKYPLSVYARAARRQECITTDELLLKEALHKS